MTRKVIIDVPARHWEIELSDYFEPDEAITDDEVFERIVFHVLNDYVEFDWEVV